MNTGIFGEFRVEVVSQEGVVTQDTGYQRNMILDQGLDFFGGGKGSNINNSCVIGAGNTPPEVTQVKLDSFLALVNVSQKTHSKEYVDEGDGLYKIWEEGRYRFEGLGSVNVSEVGLVSTGSSESNYYLTTRALIKDSLGSPTTISVKTGETLDIYYRIYKVISIADEEFSVNVVDENGGETPYIVTIRPSGIGKVNGFSISEPTVLEVGDNSDAKLLDVGVSELVSNTTTPNRTNSLSLYLNRGLVSLGGYAQGSYKRVLKYNIGLDIFNDIDIRRANLTGKDSNSRNPFQFFVFQARFGSVEGDLPIVKNSRQKLTIPFEISWGRAEEEV